MADFETKLRWLSERGNPVGAEELIERIEADLAGDPLVVVAKRREGTTMTKTGQSPTTTKPGRYRGPASAVAAFVAILAVAGLYFAFAGDADQVADTPDTETRTDLEIVEAGVDALYSGDAERAVELFELDSPDGVSRDDEIQQQAAYQAAIGGRLTLDCIEQDTPGVFTCVAPYHNTFTDAIGYVDSPGETIHIVVDDGVITEFDPEHTFIHRALKHFLAEQGRQVLAEQGRQEYSDSLCVSSVPFTQSGWLTSDCVDFALDHLDQWADWAETNLELPDTADG